jgi:hypothetical protein
MLNKIKGKKRAVSPVVATVLLISLVVAASAIVVVVVVPMLRGSSSINFITVQWFDTDGDTVVDIAYVTLQNTGTADSVIKSLNITVATSGGDEVVINETIVQGINFPLEIDAAERLDLVVDFNPEGNVVVGSNIFRVQMIGENDQVIPFQDNLKYINVIEPLDFLVLNPLNSSWISGIIDPQAVASGGFRVSTITYDFILPDETVVLQNQPIVSNVDSTSYPDDNGYKMIFSVNDSLGQSKEVTQTFGIDNVGVAVDLSLNASVIYPGDALNASWSLGYAGSPLINQTLVLSGTVFGYDQVFTSTEAIVTQYILPGTQTLHMAEDDMVFTLYVKDAAGNTNVSGEAFDLIDNIDPNTYFISPENNSDLSGYFVIEVFADDASGIDTTRFDIYFFANSSEYYYLYQQSVEKLATYVVHQKKWILYFNSYILPDDNFSIVAQVYDLSSAGNGNSTSIVASIDNDVINVYGATAIDGRGGFFFRRRGVLSFYLKNLVPYTITISEIMINWGGNSRIDWVYSIYDDTLNQYWLEAGTYDEDIAYPVAAVQGGINITDELDHHLTFQFNYGDKPTTVDFIISFYIDQLGSWETIYITNV